MKTVVNSTYSLSLCLQAIKNAYRQHKYIVVSMREGRDRSLEQNALAHAWYNEVSNIRGEQTPMEVKTFCKAHFGVPILLSECAEFGETYRAHIKGLPYQTRLQIISMIPVTSQLSVEQMSRYLQYVHDHFASLDTDPVFLEWPDGERI